MCEALLSSTQDSEILVEEPGAGILTWEIPRTEEPGGLQSMQRVRPLSD